MEEVRREAEASRSGGAPRDGDGHVTGELPDIAGNYQDQFCERAATVRGTLTFAHSTSTLSRPHITMAASSLHQHLVLSWALRR